MRTLCAHPEPHAADRIPVGTRHPVIAVLGLAAASVSSGAAGVTGRTGRRRTAAKSVGGCA
ncbi:hypothetical protein AB0H00_21435 [Nocardia sp. NPDC023852]|uniref:hypothetical protein n=1 Tax=Nocardia sp. NPDC023852 TaxID=3154697 RepID=UPI0033F0C260